MASLLVPRRAIVAGALVTITVVSFATSLLFASATSYSGYSTGYAFGNLTGSSGWTIGQGHFANHKVAWCPYDPAAQWGYGTYITSVSPPVVTLDGYGNPSYRTSFTLADIGDPSCNFGNYWADWYFGRYKRTADICSCNNGGGDVCYTGYAVNNCTQATYWGVVFSTYNK